MHFAQQLATLSKYPDTTSTEASHWARASTPIIGMFFSWDGLSIEQVTHEGDERVGLASIRRDDHLVDDGLEF